MAHPGGRPRRINEPVTIPAQGDRPERQTTRGDLFIENLSRGLSQKLSADLAGIGESTVLEWLTRGEDTNPRRDGDDEFAEFARRARDAKAQGRAIHERTITLAAVPRPVVTVKEGYRDVMAPDGTIRRVHYRDETTREEYDWRASAWRLEHIDGVKAAPTQVELSGPDGGPIDVRAEAQLLLARLDGFLEGRDAGLAEGAVIEVEASPAD